MHKKILIVIVITILFLGMSITPSTGNKLENNHKCSYILETTDKLKEMSINKHIGYVIASFPYCNGLIEWDFDTSNTSCICPNIYNPSVMGGTWMHTKERIYAIDNNNDIWKIDPESCGIALISIGGGTSELLDLSYEPTSDNLYAISTKNLYTICLDTGEATMVGSMGNSGLMISLDCDKYGNMYGLELGFPGYFYSINTSTGKATQIGPTGVSINYNAHMAYDKDYDTIYAIVFNYDEGLYEFYTIDVATGAMTLIWIFPYDLRFTVFTITYNWENRPPDIPIIEGPNIGKPGVEYEYCINASDPDYDILYVLWDWGDGSMSGWLGPYNSGIKVCNSHTWKKTGIYNISVLVKDEGGKLVRAYLEVRMPRSKATFNSLLLWFFEQFPILKNLLKL